MSRLSLVAILAAVILAVLGGGPGVVRAAAAPDRVALRVALMVVAIDVNRGYVRVSEVLNLENPTNETFQGDVALPVPDGARYITYHDGFVRPRLDGSRILDRLTVRPGAYRVAVAYSVAGSGDIPLSRSTVMPIERLAVFAAAPAQIRSSQLDPLSPVTNHGQTYARAAGRAIPPGLLTLTVAGVPGVRSWPAPAAAGFLAVLLAIGLARAATARDDETGGHR